MFGFAVEVALPAAYRTAVPSIVLSKWEPRRGRVFRARGWTLRHDIPSIYPLLQVYEQTPVEFRTAL